MLVFKQLFASFKEHCSIVKLASTVAVFARVYSIEIVVNHL